MPFVQVDDLFYYVHSLKCKCCGKEIKSAELCEECAKGNDPFQTVDNCGKDLK